MSFFKLLAELQTPGVSVFITEQKTVRVDAPNDFLTDEIKETLKLNKHLLILCFGLCPHCKGKLSFIAFARWFQVWCPKLPIHFLIEEHQINLGNSLETDRE